MTEEKKEGITVTITDTNTTKIPFCKPGEHHHVFGTCICAAAKALGEARSKRIFEKIMKDRDE